MKLQLRSRFLPLTFSFITFISTLLLNESCASIAFYENSKGSPLITLFNAAKTSIDIEIYEMNDPMVDTAIRAAINRGVKVRIVQEGKPVGAACKVFDAATDQDSEDCARSKILVNYVKRKGGQYKPFAAVLCGTPGSRCYEHGKMAIVDQKTALLSTGNFNKTSLCNLAENPSACNRDYSVTVTDQNSVRTLALIFENDLKGVAYNVQDVLNSTGSHDQLTISPYSLSPIVKLINSAQKTLQIQNQYLKEATVNSAIVNAARRGVKVNLMVASACSFAYPSQNDVNQWTKIYSAFDAAGVKTRIFTRNISINGLQGYLHAKAMIVDGKAAWVGSVNGSVTSLTNNREFGVFSNDTTLVRQLDQVMKSDFAAEQSETWQESLKCAKDPVPGSGGDFVSDPAA